MSRFRACRAAAAALVAVLSLSSTPPAAADTASDEARVVALVQQARAAAGAPALPLHAGLTAAARTWAATMAAAGTISHNVGLGSLVTASRLAENVGMASAVDVVHQGFLNSPGHHANMVDTGVNALGVGVAYANGYVFVVQDYAMVATPPPPPPPSQPPAVPTEMTPGHGAVVRVSPAQVSARYSDPEGAWGRVHFLVVDELGRAVREGDSTWVCSGCIASLPIVALPDGVYGTYAYATDGSAASAWSAPPVFAVNHTPPRAPTGLTRTAGQATAVYSDPDGTAGWVYVYLVGPSGSLLTHGFTNRVCSGCTATFALPTLAPGTHTLYAVGYDGLVSDWAGPVSFVA